ncbi:hypothetical protein O181_129683 [Austropuccinia psidii MF-1]|uniref:Uncharacterized protein n=1 Tax=Austropuccinia psidii MF-1 TaxID=1389203 RepID=A0A9Q3Q921_9BASI|nr:hypothetical protein [Austropuccinia psidii MF-1]
MLVQHSPPAWNTRSQRNPAFLTPTERAPLDCTPSVHQLSANLDRGPPMEGAALSRRGGMCHRGSGIEIQEWPGTQQSGNSLGRLQKNKG